MVDDNEELGLTFMFRGDEIIGSDDDLEPFRKQSSLALDLAHISLFFT